MTPRYLAALERGERNVTLDTFDEYAGLAFVRRCEIVPARLGPLAGLSGAAALVLDDLA